VFDNAKTAVASVVSFACLFHACPTPSPPLPPPTPCPPTISGLSCKFQLLGYIETSPGQFLSAIRIPGLKGCGVSPDASMEDFYYRAFTRSGSKSNNGTIVVQIAQLNGKSAATNYLADLQRSVQAPCPTTPATSMIATNRSPPNGANRPVDCTAQSYPTMGDQTIRLSATDNASFKGDLVLVQVGALIENVYNGFNTTLAYPPDLDASLLEQVSCWGIQDLSIG
jgi:hypothetical protein